jgi:hypothetical protein
MTGLGVDCRGFCCLFVREAAMKTPDPRTLVIAVFKEIVELSRLFLMLRRCSIVSTIPSAMVSTIEPSSCALSAEGPLTAEDVVQKLDSYVQWRKSNVQTI